MRGVPANAISEPRNEGIDPKEAKAAIDADELERGNASF